MLLIACCNRLSYVKDGFGLSTDIFHLFEIRNKYTYTFLKYWTLVVEKALQLGF